MKNVVRIVGMVLFDMLACLICVAASALIYYDLNPTYAAQLLQLVSLKYYIVLFGATFLFGAILKTYTNPDVKVVTFRDILRQACISLLSVATVITVNIFITISQPFPYSITCLFAVLFMVFSLVSRSVFRLVTDISTSRREKTTSEN